VPSNVFAGRSPLGVVALAVLGACVLPSVPGAVSRTAANIADLARHAGESFGETRVRVFGEAWVARIAEIRRQIPEDAAYFLVDAAAGTDGKNWVRRELAPRRPILLGWMSARRREFLFPARPPDAPEFVVIAREGGPPDLVPTDAFLGPEVVDPDREDVSIFTSIDAPVDGARVASPVTLSGWCQERGSRPCSSVLVLVDGVRRPERVERFSRPDVAAAVAGIGDCATAGWRLTAAFEASERGEHAAMVFFLTADGRFRRLGPVRFTVVSR
jgi:hypothetical protein